MKMTTKEAIDKYNEAESIIKLIQPNIDAISRAICIQNYLEDTYSEDESDEILELVFAHEFYPAGLNKMNNITKSNSMKGFKSAYHKLPHFVMTSVRDEIIEQTGWTIPTFHNKLNGTTPIKPLELKFLKEIFAGYNITI